MIQKGKISPTGSGLTARTGLGYEEVAENKEHGQGMNADLKYRIIRAAVKTLFWPLALLPMNTALKVGAVGGRAAFYLWASRRRFAVENIRLAREAGALPPNTPPLETARRSFENIGRNTVEIVKILFRRDQRLLDNVDIKGSEHLHQALALGNGALVITGHCGNWELMAIATPHLLPYHLSVVARAQNNPSLDRLVEEFRCRTGNKVIYKKGAIKKIVGELNQNQVVGILIDQAVLAKEGCVISFLKRPAITTKLPAVLARKKQTPVLACFIHREPDGRHQIIIQPPMEMSEDNNTDDAAISDTQQMTRYIEEFIRAYPDQWLWGHRRWKRAPASFEDMEKTTGRENNSV
jgi:KDO2-lipid IV(A) lauroyltransferase